MDRDLYKLEPLGPHHDRLGFHCGVEELDAYLKKQAAQDMRRKANAVFALSPADNPAKVAGFFTLCSYALSPGAIPEEARKHIPRYPAVSATLIGRLAVDAELQGRGVGSMLLASALIRAYENAAVVGSSMAAVDAIDEPAAQFYRKHGFIRLPDSMRLVLPMQTIAKLVSGGER
jgi:GNAT superfamily N-acetyltransferase